MSAITSDDLRVIFMADNTLPSLDYLAAMVSAEEQEIRRMCAPSPDEVQVFKRIAERQAERAIIERMQAQAQLARILAVNKAVDGYTAKDLPEPLRQLINAIEEAT